MREITGWLSPEVMRLVALALLHFLWQGLALAALASVAMSVLRGASSRYAIAVAALVLMVAAPPMTYFALRGNSAEPEAVQVQSSMATASASTHVISAAQPSKAPFVPSPEAPASSLAWLVQAWLAGVLLCSLRTAGGLLWIERLRRKDCSAIPAAILTICRALQERLGLARIIRYCECAHLQAPAVIGWFRPVVLLPATALTSLSEEQLRAVIAHELAHIKRLDAFFNLFQIAAETLFFYHPAVWWLSLRIRAERENCCDDVAVAVCGNPVEYARALARMAEWRAAPSLAMAANRSPLAARVARMLGITPRGSARNSAGLAAGILCLSAALIAGNAFVGIARTTSAAPVPRRAQAETPRDQDAAIVVRASRLPAPPRPSSPQAHPAPAPSPAPPAQPTKSKSNAKSSYIDGLKAEGIDNLSVDELVSMKIQGVTPEYVHAIHELGLHPSTHELVGLRVQGVTPAYIQELLGMGFTPNIGEIIGMKVQGVTPEYVKSLRDLKLKTGAGEVIGMKVQGVTPDYVKKLQDLGLQLDTGEVIGMKVQGVTPEYVKSLRDAGLQLDAGDLMGARVQGITPEFIAEAKSHGFKDLDLHKLMALKQSGVLDK